MQRLRKIFARVFEIDADSVDDSTSPDNTELWDSFNHLVLVSEIEKDLGIALTIPEIQTMKSFKDLKEIIVKNHEYAR